MDYKVQSRFFDPITNTTKVAIKQDFPYRVFEEILSNNRTEEDENTLVEAVLNIVRMELDPSGAVVNLKKELDKSIEANNDAIKQIKVLETYNQAKTIQIQNIKNVADWAVLVAVTDTDNPIDPTLYARGLELVDLGEVGKKYKAHDIFAVSNPNHVAKYGEGNRVLVQVNQDFTYNGESVEELEGKLSQDGKLAVWKWEMPKEHKPEQPSRVLGNQPIAQPGS
ncbi:hypothetical protein MK528_10770 [Streptococcus gordonii]|jgi:hypothetical protein|uniref:hypothetical protein n=1 Tax=Streptococcus gordonii TaxID=1302 RepID=UPI002001804D|nr:hypothetical protein [Streptococcus gordonii]MCY7168839.1 hypothetical protein [Streptococcus gordonii]DAJ39611.1 MAG TPA: Protein of unknown function (DUF1366) [Caudoviricetes sp.]